MESSSVSADLHIILNDICCGAGKYLECLENKMCIFLLFLTAVLTCLPVGPPYGAVKEVENRSASSSEPFVPILRSVLSLNLLKWRQKRWKS